MVWPYYIAFVLSRIDGFDRAIHTIPINICPLTYVQPDSSAYSD
jgi:hypothetical protein